LTENCSKKNVVDTQATTCWFGRNSVVVESPFEADVQIRFGEIKSGAKDGT
jgi:hypothetical protein